MDLNDIQKTLNDLSARFDLVNQATKSSESIIINLSREGKDKLGGFESSELICEFKCQKLVFNSHLRQEPFISTEVGIYIKDEDGIWVGGLKPVGTYELETNLKGEHIDDWLWFSETKR